MNYGIVQRVLGIILIIESSLMLPSLLMSFKEGMETFNSFLFTIIIGYILGFILAKLSEKSKQIRVREGLAIVTLGWIVASIIGALPLYISGAVPSYIDCLFEIVSGFTTTGATIISNVEILPNSILFWRSLTHWIGGMGILVFTVSLLPALGIGGFQIFKAESPGPIAGKIAPRIKDTANILYRTYFAITILEIIFLLFGGMSLFDSLVYTFGTVGTGGFATKNSSVGFYNSTYIHIVIGTFMILSGVNFSLYYSLFQGKVKDIRENDELKYYIGIIVVATILIGLNLYFSGYGKMGISLRDSYFQVGSLMTTTGYSTADFNLWPSFSKGILFLLMFIGASAGSTAGGMKVIRLVVVLKLIKREFTKMFHPRAIVPIKVNGKIMNRDLIESILGFMGLYMIIFVIGTLFVSLDDVDLFTASSSVVATLSNIGPGFELVGPTSNFGFYSPFTKIILTLFMLMGRLELFTFLALFTPKSFKTEIID